MVHFVLGNKLTRQQIKVDKWGMDRYDLSIKLCTILGLGFYFLFQNNHKMAATFSEPTGSISM